MGTDAPAALLRCGARRSPWWAGVALWLFAFGVQAQDDALAPRRALGVEAAYLVNFLRYAEWPARPAQGPLVVSVVGASRVADTVEAVAEVAGAVQGRAVEVRRVVYPWRSGSAEEIAEAEAKLAESHLVYVHRSAARSAPRVARALRGKPVLTVSNVEGFVEEGGMLELFQSGRNILFTANPAALQGSGVVLSSRVLQLARPVEVER